MRMSDWSSDVCSSDLGSEKAVSMDSGLREKGEERALEPAEAALIDALDLAETEARAAVEAEDFERAMAALSRLRAPIDAFFDQVTVNDARPHLRAAQIGSEACRERVCKYV